MNATTTRIIIERTIGGMYRVVETGPGGFTVFGEYSDLMTAYAVARRYDRVER